MACLVTGGVMSSSLSSSIIALFLDTFLLLIGELSPVTLVVFPLLLLLLTVLDLVWKELFMIGDNMVQ